jgi:hypothetical protein
MAVVELFSQRQKKLRQEVSDVYVYDQVPSELRVQVLYILDDAIGDFNNIAKIDDMRMAIYIEMYHLLCRGYGEFKLVDNEHGDKRADLRRFFLSARDERALDVIDLAFKFINSRVRNERYQSKVRPTLKPDEAISELNHRFKQHGIGYEFQSGELIRVDSQFIHQSAVLPVLNLLSDTAYKGANEEYRKAFEHYRHGNHKECLNECLKAFESTMKVICIKRGWSHNPNDTAKKLLEICFQNELIPSYLQSEFTSLRTSLESGVPTVRNKLGGHGQGAQPTTVPPYLASYLLHLTATNILLLVEAEKALP